jgi:hypothetical protein
VLNGAQLFVFQWLAWPALNTVLSLICGPFAVRLFNKVIPCTKTSDRINPIFRSFLARLGQTRQTAKRKHVPGWQAFLMAMGAS